MLEKNQTQMSTFNFLGMLVTHRWVWWTLTILCPLSSNQLHWWTSAIFKTYWGMLRIEPFEWEVQILALCNKHRASSILVLRAKSFGWNGGIKLLLNILYDCFKAQYFCGTKNPVLDYYFYCWTMQVHVFLLVVWGLRSTSRELLFYQGQLCARMCLP